MMNRNEKWQRNRKNKKLFFSLILSITLHAFIIFLISFLVKTIDKGNKKVEKEPKEKESLQVVSLLKTNSDKSSKPSDAKFASTENHDAKIESALRETKSVRVKSPNKVEKTPKKPRKIRKNIKKKVKKVRKQVKRVKLRKNINKLAVKPSKTNSNPKISSDTKKLKPLKLYPSDAEVDRILGITPSDYIPGVKSGKQTALKSKKWVGASFFMRIKNAVSQVWSPGTVYKKHDPDGSVYGFKNWFTVLKVTLDSQGTVKKIIILKNSGLKFLDMEAYRAFMLAGPFPNPPKEIINPKTGLITFKFGFLVEVSTKVDFKLFRF